MRAFPGGASMSRTDSMDCSSIERRRKHASPFPRTTCAIPAWPLKPIQCPTHSNGTGIIAVNPAKCPLERCGMSHRHRLCTWLCASPWLPPWQGVLSPDLRQIPGHGRRSHTLDRRPATPASWSMAVSQTTGRPQRRGAACRPAGASASRSPTHSPPIQCPC